ncbi:MAG: RND family transporter [Candidatus Izemoplasmatales bacterium]
MKKWLIIVFFASLVALSGFLITKVNVNYDLQEYLPEDSDIVKGINEYSDEFGSSSQAYIAIDENSVSQALELKEEILMNENVKEVIFVDTYLNELTYSIIRSKLQTEQQIVLDSSMSILISQGLTYPEALYQIANYFPELEKQVIQDQYSEFVSENNVLFQVVFKTTTSDNKTEETLDELVSSLDDMGYQVRMKGDVVSNIFTKNTITEETKLITIIIIPLIIIVLLVLSKSLFDIIIFIIVAGVSIIINLGTNAIFPSISYITQSMAIALQLAISLDYIIFTLNSYHEIKKDSDLSCDQAIKIALKKIHRPVIASALTTMVSFLALVVMKFSIGLDIGLVFAKAILISLFSTLILLPVLIRFFSKLIDKTKKSTKIIDFNWFANFSEKAKKYRYLFLAFILAIIGPLIYFQAQNEFTFGVNSFSASKGTSYYEDSEFIDQEFGLKNTIVILVEKDDLKEVQVYQQIKDLDSVKSLDAGIYYKNVISNPIILSQVVENLYSENYALMKINVDSDIESTESFKIYEDISGIIKDTYPNQSYILGETAISYEIKDIIVRDFTYVTLLAIFMVMLIIFISFKNILIPTVLITIIEIAVFLSMSLINLFDQDLVFLAYLIVTTILLGATIDYAILFSKRYTEVREKNSKEISIRKASIEATPSIVTSALLFIISGLTISMISSINSISQIGLLIALGAFVSMIFVLVILPQILYIFDFLIIKSKIKIS